MVQSKINKYASGENRSGSGENKCASGQDTTRHINMTQLDSRMANMGWCVYLYACTQIRACAYVRHRAVVCLVAYVCNTYAYARM